MPILVWLIRSAFCHGPNGRVGLETGGKELDRRERTESRRDMAGLPSGSSADAEMARFFKIPQEPFGPENELFGVEWFGERVIG